LFDAFHLKAFHFCHLPLNYRIDQHIISFFFSTTKIYMHCKDIYTNLEPISSNNCIRFLTLRHIFRKMKLFVSSNVNENAENITALSVLICSWKNTLDNMGKIHCLEKFQAPTCESTAMQGCKRISINYPHMN